MSLRLSTNTLLNWYSVEILSKVSILKRRQTFSLSRGSVWSRKKMSCRIRTEFRHNISTQRARAGRTNLNREMELWKKIISGESTCFLLLELNKNYRKLECFFFFDSIEIPPYIQGWRGGVDKKIRTPCNLELHIARVNAAAYELRSEKRKFLFSEQT